MSDAPNRNYGIPCISNQDSTIFRALEPVDLNKDFSFKYDESWLQDIIFNNTELLPINEIDPIFGNLIPVCREIRTPVGPLDSLFINELGMLTLVECKLWRNPEARRKVVGQILDYAQEFSRWSYEELLIAVQNALKVNDNVLYNLIIKRNDTIKESEFIDNVTRNLKKGRFLLLIVGDGIRENVENISSFLQEHAQLNFTFALIEQRIFKLPTSFGQGILIQPRVIAKTVEIERTVIRIEGNNVSIESPSAEKIISQNTRKRRSNITEQVFYEGLSKIDPDLPNELQDFFERVKEFGLIIETGASGLMLKTKDRSFNFGLFHRDGYIRNYACGGTKLGDKYLEKLANIIGNSTVLVASDGFSSTVKKNTGEYVSISEALLKKNEWIDLIANILSEIDT